MIVLQMAQRGAQSMKHLAPVQNVLHLDNFRPYGDLGIWTPGIACSTGSQELKIGACLTGCSEHFSVTV